MGKLWRAVAVLGALLALWAGAALAEDGEKTILEIYDRAGLEAIEQYPTASYRLCDDIDLGDEPWQPFAFSGVLDGNGHTVYNLTIRDVDPEQRCVTVDGNHKEYDTVFSGLFSTGIGCAIRNLHILGIDMEVTTAENCFVGGFLGYAEDVSIEDCSLSGRITLNCAGTMFGAGGAVGFGNGDVRRSTLDTTIVTTDKSLEIVCEQFLGGVLACGWGNVNRCEVTLAGYASVHGYVHTGGCIGMAHAHNDTYQRGHWKIYSCTVQGAIHFFEHNIHRRAYCRALIGENLHTQIQVDDSCYNYVPRFQRDEVKVFDVDLLPEKCENPVYTEAVTPPTAETFGYTTYTCSQCGYSYRGRYTRLGE